MRSPLLVHALFALALAGCSNPFLDHYRGVRLPAVSTAQVATQAPRDATLIGVSDFTTGVVVGDAEAIAAAERVGANIVQWDRAFLRHDVVLASAAVLGDSGGTAPLPAQPATAGEAPPVRDGAWYRISARFWRSHGLGGFPPERPVTADPAGAPANAASEARSRPGGPSPSEPVQPSPPELPNEPPQERSIPASDDAS